MHDSVIMKIPTTDMDNRVGSAVSIFLFPLPLFALKPN